MTNGEYWKDLLDFAHGAASIKDIAGRRRETQTRVRQLLNGKAEHLGLRSVEEAIADPEETRRRVRAQIRPEVPLRGGATPEEMFYEILQQEAADRAEQEAADRADRGVEIWARWKRHRELP